MTAARIPAEGFDDAELDAIPTDPRLVIDGLVNISACGRTDREALIGRNVAEVLYSGARVVGTVESVDATGTPLARLADGRFIRLGHLIDLVDEPATNADGAAPHSDEECPSPTCTAQHVAEADPDDDAAELARPTDGGRRYTRGAVHYFPFTDPGVALCGVSSRGSIDTEAAISCRACTA